MNRSLLALMLLSIMLLAACDNEPTAVPTLIQNPPPPTETPLPVTESAEETDEPEVLDMELDVEDLLDESALAEGEVDLRFAGVVEGRLGTGRALAVVEAVEANSAESPEYYRLTVDMGAIVPELQRVIIHFRADLEPGVYRITRLVSDGFGDDDDVLGLVTGDGPDFGVIVDGLLRFDRVDEKFTGSFAISAGFDDGIVVRGAFGTIPTQMFVDDAPTEET